MSSRVRSWWKSVRENDVLTYSISISPCSRTIMSTEHSDQQTGIEDIWYLKEIAFGPELKPVKIITQNYNG